MKKEGYLYQCTVGPEGRLSGGVWAKAKGVPRPLPEGVAVFEEFPANRSGGRDYLWDGENLIYSPETNAPETNAPETNASEESEASK